MIDESRVTGSGIDGERAVSSAKPSPLADYESHACTELFRCLPIPCVETTLGGVTLRANEEAERLLNVPLRMLIGKPLLYFVARSDCMVFRAAVECVGDGQPLDSVSLRFRPRRGPPIARIQLSGRRLGEVCPQTIVWTMGRI
jgi:PAS domain-containing protein